MQGNVERIQRLHRVALDASARFIDSSSLLGDRLRLGIASRLVVAFVGVGALVLAANFIVEQGVLVVRTTEVTRTVATPVAVQIPTPAAVRLPLPDKVPEPLVIPVEHRVVTSDALLLAVAHFGESLQARTRAKNDSDDAYYRNAGADMKRACTAFTATAAAIAGKSFAKVDAALKNYAQAAEAWIGQGDQLRELRKIRIDVRRVECP